MKIDIEISIEYSSWQKIIGIEEDYFSTEDNPNQEFLPSIIKRLQEISNIAIEKHPGLGHFEVKAVSLLLSDDKKITELNNQYRNKNKPTNVLSFPENEFISPGNLEENIIDDYIYLGDVAMSYQTIARQAKEKFISIDEHFLHLYVHSLLHLIGHDHVNDAGADVMQSIEIEILSKFGIKSPYE